MKFLPVGLLGLCVVLGGCTFVNARRDMEQSKIAYKACLSEHPGDLAACNSQRAAFEADVAAYETISKASYLLGGGSVGGSRSLHCTSTPMGGMTSTNCN